MLLALGEEGNLTRIGISNDNLDEQMLHGGSYYGLECTLTFVRKLKNIVPFLITSKTLGLSTFRFFGKLSIFVFSFS